MNKKHAFSLVELLISLIIISLIIAAFIPIMSKKKNKSTTIGTKEETNLTNDCKIFSSPEFVEGGLCETCGNCTLCDGKKYCITCEGLICNTENFESLDNKTCRCINCKNINPECLACTAETCTECIYGKYPSGKKCLDCPEPCSDCSAKNICTECKAGYYLYEGKCIPCPKGTYSNKNNSENSCTKCPANTYNDKEGSTECIACPSGKCSSEGQTKCIACVNGCNIYNDSGCAECKEGYYQIATKCYECTIAHCKTCTANNNCQECLPGYHINKTSPNYCWPNITTKNAGDEGGPIIPPGVQICQAGQPCSAGENFSIPTCWQGVTAITSGDNICTSLNSYSGCTRTVCNWAAANTICAYNKMYLPSQAQWITLRNNYTYTSKYTGLVEYNLCDSTLTSNTQTRCHYINCPGTYEGCNPQGHWAGANLALFSLQGGSLYGPSKPHHGTAFSVRCAWD